MRLFPNVYQDFFIPYKFPSQNEVIGWLKSQKGARIYSGQKKKYQEKVAEELMVNKIKPVKGPVHIHFTWIEENRRRDWDNITFAQKFILDALVAAGIIPDDRRKVVQGITHKIPDELINKNMPGVLVRLEEINGKEGPEA